MSLSKAMIALVLCGILLSCGHGTTASVSGGNNSSGANTAGANGKGAWSVMSATQMRTGGAYNTGNAVMSDGNFIAIASRRAELFDATAKRWVDLPALPAAFGTYHYGKACKLANSDKILLIVTAENPYNPATPYGDNRFALLYDYAANTWQQTGDLNKARAFYELVCLSDGQALIAGGYLYDDIISGTATATPTAEMFDPASGAWRTISPMNKGRLLFSFQAMPNGQAIAIGGTLQKDTSENAALESSAEVYDTATNTWTDTSALNTGRSLAESVLLHDGRVMVTGGYNISSHQSYLNSAEIYDPQSNTWILVAPMAKKRTGHAMKVLVDGTVMIAGGRWQDELYEVVTINGQQVGSITINGAYILTDAEIFDPVAGSWTQAASMNFKREYPLLFPLANGGAFVCGGWDAADTYYDSCEEYSQ